MNFQIVVTKSQQIIDEFAERLVDVKMRKAVINESRNILDVLRVNEQQR